jgi:serine/threonine-protein kinase HipA
MSRNEIRLGLKSLKVKCCGKDVGTLALTNDKKVAFSYSEQWLMDGFSISPFSLPLEEKVFVPNKFYFHGLFGIFADSLPDAWGTLLLNRILKEHNIKEEINILDRLALVGNQGMGILEYEPAYELVEEQDAKDLDYLSAQCQKVLQTEFSEDLDLLYKMAGSSGGARPKILTHIEDKDWMIKFPAHIDSDDIGKQEYDYSICAKKCGINMTETKLFLSKFCSGYFGTVRFDRTQGTNRKIHMATAAALLEADFQAPCLDYHMLMKLTRILTRENKSDIENMFRRMCFNVWAHNRDDHAKNFSFLYDENTHGWRLSPAYDLTYSDTYFGEHTTSVDGNGKNPGMKELLNVGVQAGMKKEVCEKIVKEIKSIVEDELGIYL